MRKEDEDDDDEEEEEDNDMTKHVVKANKNNDQTLVDSHLSDSSS